MLTAIHYSITVWLRYFFSRWLVTRVLEWGMEFKIHWFFVIHSALQQHNSQITTHGVFKAVSEAFTAPSTSEVGKYSSSDYVQTSPYFSEVSLGHSCIFLSWSCTFSSLYPCESPCYSLTAHDQVNIVDPSDWTKWPQLEKYYTDLKARALVEFRLHFLRD